jgi:7-carboxy-7-deazaguanine synthase
MSALDISQKCCEFGISNITMTGGEPLMDTDVLFLVAILSSMNFKINIETNGSIDFEPYLSIDNVMITMDYKTMSSGYDSEMIEELIELLRPQDNLKFVVGTTEDLMQMCSALNAFPTKSEVFVSPIFEKIDPKDIVKFLIANKIENIRLQLQAHKIIWAPDMRGV